MKVLMIVLSAIVTMLPRIVPFYASSALSHLPRFLQKCMKLLPVAALGALIFPLALTDFGNAWYAGALGVAIAFAAAIKKMPMIISIILALLASTLVLVAVGIA